MKTDSMTLPMLKAFGEAFTHKGNIHNGIRDLVEIENDAGYRVASVVYVSEVVANQLTQGDIVQFSGQTQQAIKRIGKMVDCFVEVELSV